MNMLNICIIFGLFAFKRETPTNKTHGSWLVASLVSLNMSAESSHRSALIDVYVHSLLEDMRLMMFQDVPAIAFVSLWPVRGFATRADSTNHKPPRVSAPQHLCTVRRTKQ